MDNNFLPDPKSDSNSFEIKWVYPEREQRNNALKLACDAGFINEGDEDDPNRKAIENYRAIGMLELKLEKICQFCLFELFDGASKQTLFDLAFQKKAYAKITALAIAKDAGLFKGTLAIQNRDALLEHPVIEKVSVLLNLMDDNKLLNQKNFQKLLNILNTLSQQSQSELDQFVSVFEQISDNEYFVCTEGQENFDIFCEGYQHPATMLRWLEMQRDTAYVLIRTNWVAILKNLHLPDLPHLYHTLYQASFFSVKDTTTGQAYFNALMTYAPLLFKTEKLTQLWLKVSFRNFSEEVWQKTIRLCQLEDTSELESYIFDVISNKSTSSKKVTFSEPLYSFHFFDEYDAADIEYDASDIDDAIATSQSTVACQTY